jgi:hypothetical protein
MMRRTALLAIVIAAVAVLGGGFYLFGPLQFLRGLFVLQLAACATLSWIFVARHAHTRWWGTLGGRYLMKSKTAFALLFSLWLFATAVPLRPMTSAVLAVLLFGWIAYVLVDLLLLQSRELKAARAARGVVRPRR